MKLHFEPNLDYQIQAIEAACNLFRGQEICRTEFTVTRDPADAQQRMGFAENDLGIGNRLTLLDDELLRNLNDIQLRNGLPPSVSLASGDFTIEIVASSTQPVNTYAMMFGKQKTDAAPYPGPGLFMNYPIPSATTFGVQLEGLPAYALGSPTTGVNDGNTRLYGGRRTGMILEARLNGALSAMSVLPAAPLDLSTAGFPAFVGGHPASGTVIQALQGNVAEIVAVAGTITTADLTKLEKYLEAKYGL